ncbi:MAG TPA: hypothetical protein VGK93_07605 [Candidatus Eisenbacteria bacterium]
MMMARCVAAGEPAAVVSDPACGVVAVVQRSSTVQYLLPHAFLRAGTDSIWTARGSLLRDVDYALDRTRGVLRLLREPIPGETLLVRACWLMDPPPLELQLQAYHPVPAVGSGAAVDSQPVEPGWFTPRRMTARSPTEAPIGTSLLLTGNKTVAVDFGSNQDAFFRQSLDLGVTGTLAPGVELTGVLSDRNTPLTAEGSTQDLQSIDRLLIELRAPNGGAALGDVSLNLQRGEFARLERHLQGVRGEWGTGDLRGVVAAASAQGEYHRLQFFGVEGRQGPYLLTDRQGGTGITVVPGSEVVTVDGERLIRGESADYAMDYDQARLTFTNRRPITSASRITVEYQFAVNRFRRNLAATAASWQRGGWYAHTTLLTEYDDGGRPLGTAFDAGDRLVLAAAGDSAGAALGGGVTSGRGDYDLSPDSGFVFVGRDSGRYALQFTRVGAGRGDYAESGSSAGRIAYRYVGSGNGEYRIGRSLPLPDSRQLWSLAGGVRRGPATLDLEGALSRHDLNTFSSRDDDDNLGRAGSASLALEGAVPFWLGRHGGLSARLRTVESRFQPFSRLERPFTEEDWGLPSGGDLDHQTRTEVSGFLRPLGGELKAMLGRLETPDGFRSWRRSAEWRNSGTVTTLLRWDRADGEQDRISFPRGGRERESGELGLQLPWLEPRVRGDWDERRFPSDTGRVGERSRELGGELRSPRNLAWQGQAGYAVRREARLTALGFEDQAEARTASLGLQTPAAAPWGAVLSYQRRQWMPLADARRTRSDLASARLRAADARRGLSGILNLEITSEGENARRRVLTFVGPGQGAYDSLGNLVGTGSYDLSLTVDPALRPVSRTATSARLAWQFGASEAWRGSRIEFAFESEGRRRGAARVTDALLSPAVTLGDGGLSRASLSQRLEAELAPGSRAGALRLRLERRASSDRGYENFSQTSEERRSSARWRARPGTGWTTELEARWDRREATQALGASSSFRRALDEGGALGQLSFAPDARRRAAASVDASWSRAGGGAASGWTRTLQLGPDASVAVGARGTVELSARRALQWGPPALSLLPSTDPAGAPRWQGSARVDYRLRESTTLGISWTLIDRSGAATQHTGRAELRAFF